MTPKREWEHNHTDLPKCPHCGAEDEGWWEAGLVEDSATDMRCGVCGEGYRVKIHVSTSFSTRVLTEADATLDELIEKRRSVSLQRWNAQCAGAAHAITLLEQELAHLRELIAERRAKREYYD